MPSDRALRDFVSMQASSWWWESQKERTPSRSSVADLTAGVDAALAQLSDRVSDALVCVHHGFVDV